DLPAERLVGAEQELLPGLAAGIEGARDLGAAEGAVVEQAAVFAGEGHALGDALVDDVDRQLGQAVDVGLARAEIAALDGVVEEPEDAVAVVVVVLRGVDATLGGDRMRAARRVLKAEALDLVAELAEAGGGGGAGPAPAHHQHGELALVARVDQPQVVAVLEPLRGQRASRDLAVELDLRGCHLILGRLDLGVNQLGSTRWVSTATGNEMLPRVISQANACAKPLRQRLKRGWFQPSRSEEH